MCCTTLPCEDIFLTMSLMICVLILSTYFIFRLSDVALISIANSFPHLQSINIRNCSFTDDAMIVFADKCHELQTIIANTCSNITATGLQALVAANPHITTLRISHNAFVSDDCIIHLAQYCHWLEKIDISWCAQATDDAVLSLARSCTKLTDLDLRFCTNLTDTSMIALAIFAYK